MKSSWYLFVAAVLACCGITSTASAAPSFGTPGDPVILPSGGTVQVTFLDYVAGYHNAAYFVTAVSPIGGTFLFQREDAFGTTVQLPGSFAAGEELIFRLDVDEDNNGSIEQSYYSGDSLRNPDSIAHASVEAWSGNTTRVGFEDIFGGGDLDFDDMVFSVTVVPEPASLVAWTLIGTAFGVGAWKRRRKAA